MPKRFRDHLYQRLKAAREATGLDAYFGTHTATWGQTVRLGAPGQSAQGRCLGDSRLICKIGRDTALRDGDYLRRRYCRHVWFRSEAFSKRQWQDVVADDQAFVLLDLAPGFFVGHGEDQYHAAYREDRINGDRYFWLAAHRCVPATSARPWSVDLDGESFPGGAASMPPGGPFAEAFGRTNHLYNAALPYMHRLRLTPGGQYVSGWMNTISRR